MKQEIIQVETSHTKSPVFKGNLRIKAGLFGFTFHFLFMGLFLAYRYYRGERYTTEFLILTLPIFFITSFVIYAFIIGKYMTKRENLLKPLFKDCLISILTEYLVFTVASLANGFVIGLMAGINSAQPDMIGLIGTNILMNLLWVYATFVIHIVALGNASGLIGWYIIKKFKEKYDKE